MNEYLSKRTPGKRAWLIPILLLCLWIPSLTGQITTATLNGTAKDASGAIVPGAAIEARNTGTDLVRSTVSDASGQFVLSDLPAGHYSVRVTMAGFKAWVLSDLELQMSQHASLNPVLDVGSVDQELTVTAVIPMLNTVTSSVGQVVNTSAVERMPINGRSFWQLTQLTPGAIPAPVAQNTASNGSAIRAKSVNVTINGTSPIWTGWALDGAPITESQAGGTLVQPNVDAIQEFKVEGANMPAEYGHFPTLVSASLKSGSNTFHGNVFEFFRNDKLDARNFFYTPPVGSSLTKEPLRRNEYGATLGGPIRRNRTFFFADFERTDVRQGGDFNNVVPSLSQRSGDFSGLLSLAKPTSLVDPTTRTAFANNQIPTARISSQATYFLQYLPQPNILQGTTSRATLTNNESLDTSKGDVRIDHQLTNADQLMGRYSITDNSEDDPNPFPALGMPSLHSRAQNAVLSEVHIFNPNWVNNLRVSYYRSIFLFGAILQGTNINQAAGVQGFDDLTSIYSFPSIAITGYTGYTGSPSDQRPKSNRIRSWNYGDTASLSTGRHDIKFGAELSHQTLAFFNGGNSVGVFNFLGTYSNNAFADFLLGYPNNVTRAQYQNLFGLVGNFWSTFVQDNIRLSNSVTLNLGLRWEVNPFFSGIRGQKTGFGRATGKLVVASNADPTAQIYAQQQFSAYSDRMVATSSLGLPDSIERASKGDVAPRIGLAWRPFGSTTWVFRSAYGLFYVMPDANTLNNTGNSTPFVASQTLYNDTAPAVPTRTWTNFFSGQPMISTNSTGQVCSFGFAAISCSTPNVSAGEIDMHSTYLQQWNVSVQKQITGSTALDLAYVGNKVTHLNQSWSINDPAPGAGTIQTRRPYPQWGTITYPVFDENANYNSLQAKIEARAWRGLNLLGAYTYSKCIDSGSSESGGTVLLIPTNRAVCDYDVPHSFSGSFDYQLPFGRGQRLLSGAHGAIQHLVGNWELAGIVTARSGQPFSPTVSGDPENTGVSTRADLVGKVVMPRTVGCWFYTSANSACTAALPNISDAFASPPSRTRYGNAGRNILRGDNLSQIDFAVIKQLAFTESKALEFRAEGFNILNHPTFSNPSTDINSSSGGQVASTVNAARVIQLALKLRF